MQSMATDAPCRRRNRSSLHRQAIGHQLSHVAATLSLDAIVLADDLGRPLAHAGNTELSTMLAELAMWATSEDIMDEATLERIRVLYPDLEDRHFATKTIDLPGAVGTRVIAAGKSFARCLGVDHAIDGIQRICTTAKPGTFARVSTTAPMYTGVPRQRRRESGVRWLIFKH